MPRVLRFVEPMLNAHDIALGAFVAGEVFTASRDVGAISFTGIADDLQDARRAVNRPAAAPERPTDNGNAEDLAKKKEEELKKAKEDEFVTGFKAGVMPAVAGGMIPMDDPFTNGFIKGFFLDGIGGDVQAVADFANDPLAIPREIFNAGYAIGNAMYSALDSWFSMSDSERDRAIANASSHLAAEAQVWTSLGQKLLTGQGQLNEAELNKLRIIADIANVIAGEISKAISDITPEDLGRIAGMIAYELAIETGITVAATVTAGAATTLSAARIALLTKKLKRLNRFGEKAAELLKADGKLVAKLKELFSELKANGKLDAAKHLDLLKIKCFSRDTLVHTATGPRPIGEIEPGEQIWSYHFERGVWGLCDVKERLDNTYSGPVISITVDNTTIEATAYHPFWVIEGRDLQERSKPRQLQEHEDEGHSLPGRWVNSHELRAGDCIITRSGTRALITEIRQRFNDAFPVSNLSIIGHHNYAVGDVGVLVHNEPICNDAIAVAKKDLGAGKSIDEIQDSLNQMVKNGKHTQQEADDALAKILDPNWKPEGTVAPVTGIRGNVTDWPSHLPTSHLHPDLPIYQGGKTLGILEDLGDAVRLQSGVAGPGASVGRTLGNVSEEARIALQHVEGHAAAILRQSGAKQASLTINYIKPGRVGPCPHCVDGVSELLLPGQRLFVRFPKPNGGTGVGYFEGGVKGFVEL